MSSRAGEGHTYVWILLRMRWAFFYRSLVPEPLTGVAVQVIATCPTSCALVHGIPGKQVGCRRP